MDPIIIGKLVGTLSYMALEYWLGKTDRVKYGSVIEAVISGVKYFKPSKEEPKK